MRVIATFSGPCAAGALTARLAVSFHDFKSLARLPKLATSYIITTPTTQEDQAMSELLPLDRIATEGTQARVALSETIIHEYAEALKQGDEFPPIDVYYDDTTYRLGDGFHRVQAAKEAGLNALAAT